MSRTTETLRLKRIVLESGGYIAKLCPRCGWWELEGGNGENFKRDYCLDIRCKCRQLSKGECKMGNDIDKYKPHIWTGGGMSKGYKFMMCPECGKRGVSSRVISKKLIRKCCKYCGWLEA